MYPSPETVNVAPVYPVPILSIITFSIPPAE